MREIPRAQAKRYILRHQGLLGPRRFTGEVGVLDFTRQAGCVQYDPVNVCGRSPELTYLARLDGFAADWLNKALYEDRLLVDHFDKNLAIHPREDWPRLAYSRERWAVGGRSNGQIDGIRKQVLDYIREKGPQSAATLGVEGKVDWYWASSTLARAALEQLYYEGELLISSKQGVIKTYDLAGRLLPRELLGTAEPHEDELARACWYLKRRLRAVGFLGKGGSDAYLGSPLYSAPLRLKAFEKLLKTGDIAELKVEGVKSPLYINREDLPLLEDSVKPVDDKPRSELIAPLDSLLWDRKLIAALFGFQYTWEIYTPAHKRAYGAYVLPILYGEDFIGRVEPVCDRKAGVMAIRNLWWEEGLKPGRSAKAAVNRALSRLAAYNACKPELL